MRAAIIVYSLTGNTLRLSEVVAARLGVEVSRLSAPSIKVGFMSVFWLGFATLIGRKVDVSLVGPGPEGQDIVILAAPVWAGRMALPMRRWLETGPDLPPKVALVMTGGSPTQSDRAFADFSRLTRKKPVLQLYASEAQMKSMADLGQIEAFCRKLDQLIKTPIAPCSDTSAPPG
jgi:hypothetical protein